jgi:WD40 repeat protein
VDDERLRVKTVAERLNGELSDVARFQTVRWEEKHYKAHATFQTQIPEAGDCDIVVAIFWARLGSELPPEFPRMSDGNPYASGSAYEVLSAIEARKRQEQATPVTGETEGRHPDVYVFKKKSPPFPPPRNEKELAVNPLQWQRLKAFFERWFISPEGHFLAAFQNFETTDEFEIQLEKLLRSWMEESVLHGRAVLWPIATKGSPFRGLSFFDAAHARVFYGRARDVARAVDRLKAAAERKTPFLLIVGASGCGKSSLARAGLVPRLITSGVVSAVDQWRVAVMQVGNTPNLFEDLSEALFTGSDQNGLPGIPEIAEGDNKTPTELAKLLRGGDETSIRPIMRALERIAESERDRGGFERQVQVKLLLVIDQLDNLFAVDVAREQRASFARLLRALTASGQIWIVATLRAALYEPFLSELDLKTLKDAGADYDLAPPGPAELAEIVRRPAEAAGLDFERNAAGVSLDDRLLEEAGGADTLPLVQFTLQKLFENRRVGDKRTLLTVAAYDALGGIGGAIDQVAEYAFGDLGEAERDALPRLLRQLVIPVHESTADPAGRSALTIRAVHLAEAATNTVERRLIDALVEASILVLSKNDGVATVHLAHQRVLESWKRAKEIVASNIEFFRVRAEIGDQRRRWIASGRKAELLIARGLPLAEAEQILATHGAELDADTRSFITASRRRARLRRQLIVSVAGAFGVIVLAAYIQAQVNLNFARLTRAEQYLVEERPAAAHALAAEATGNGLFALLQQLFSKLGGTQDDSILVKTILKIAQPASAVPIFSAMLRDPTKPVGGQSVAFSPDGRHFAVADTDGKVTVFRTEDRSVRYVLRGHNEGEMVEAVRFSPDGKWLATASDDKTIRLWNLATFASRELGAADGHTSNVVDLAFHPTRPLLASASNDGHVMVWDIEKFLKLQDFPARKNASGAVSWALSVSFSHDGTLLASSDDDGRIIIRHAADWKTIREIATGRTDLISIDFSPDDRTVASASILGVLNFWNVATGDKLASLSDQRDKLWKVRFSPDGKLIAAASWDGSVRFWNAKTYNYAGTLDGNDLWVTDVAFFTDPAAKLPLLALTTDRSGAVRLWQLNALHPMFLTFHDSDRETLKGVYSGDRSLFATGARDGYMRLYHVLQSGGMEFICQAPHEDWVTSIAFAPSGNLVYSAGISEGQLHNSIKIWETAAAATAKNAAEIPSRQSPPECGARLPIDVGGNLVNELAVSSDGKTLAWVTLAGEVWLKDVALNRASYTLPYDGKGPLRTLDYSGDGKWLAVGGNDQGRAVKRVMLWDIAASKFAAPLAVHRSAIWHLRFSPNSDWLASDGDDGIFVWHPTPGNTPVAHLQVRSAPNGDIAFNATGNYFAFGAENREISLWSVGDWKKEYELDGLVGVRGVYGFDRDDNLAFDGEDGLVRILPKSTTQPPAGATITGEVKGVDVFFDTNLTSVPPVTPLICVDATCPPPASPPEP